MYGGLSNIPVLQLEKDDLNSELKHNHAYDPAMQYLYLWTKLKELSETACILSYNRDKGMIF